MRKTLLLTLVLFGYLSFASFGQSCPLGLSGTFKIGPTGNFLTLQAAMDTIHHEGLAGPVILELQTAYSSSVESFPLRFTSAPCAAEGRGISIRPEAGAGPLSISSNDSIATIEFDHASYVLLDGRAGGVGNSNDLSVSNSHILGTTILIKGGSGYDVVKYIDVQGVSGYSGVITIGNVYDTLGNSYNRIDSCNISDGATAPANGIYNGGGGVTNKGNVINGCHISNFDSPWPGAASGICILSGNDSVTITGNSIYRTKTPYYSPFSSLGVLYGIRVSTPYNGGDIVSGNYIGGTAPQAGGSVLSLGHCGEFYGISICNFKGPALASQVTDNTITNITWSQITGNYTMIQLGGGGAFQGVCKHNRIGNSGPGNSISVLSRPDTAGYGNYSLTGIFLQSTDGTDPVTIAGNTVGGFMGNTDYSSYGFMTGIGAYGYNSSNYTISDNQIGDSTAPNGFFQMKTGSCTGINLYGGSQSPDSVVIQNNRIINLRSGNNVPGSFGNRAIGIQYTGFVNGSIRINGNQIHGLYVEGGDNDIPTLAGIYTPVNDASTSYGSKGTLTCNGNTISQLVCGNGRTAPTCDELVYGICASAPSTSHNFHFTISGNLIENLWLTNSAYVSDNFATDVEGISLGTDGAGASLVDNNMIRLGLDSAGLPVNYSYVMVGIDDGGGPNSYLHNSVYIHDEATYKPDISYGACISLYPDTISRFIMNNIFACRRDTSADPVVGGIGLPYDLTGIHADYNLYDHIGKGSYLGGGGKLSTPHATTDSLAEWQSAQGLDQHSLAGDPLFIHPDGSMAELNLHVAYGSPIESAGTPAYTTLTDFDGEIRTELTPVDIGADAGIFSAQTPPSPPPPPVVPPVTPVDSSSRDSSSIAVAFPNPFHNTLYVQVNAPQAGVASIAIYDLSSQLVMMIQVNVVKGINVVPIPTSSLAPGIYVVKVDLEGRSSSILVMKSMP